MLAAEGASVIVHGRNESRTRDVAAAIRSAGSRYNPVLSNRATAQHWLLATTLRLRWLGTWPAGE